MLKFIETFFLGLVIACTALIVQAFVSVIAELFFRINFAFQYLSTDSIQHVGFVMFIAASIEEILRYIIIKKRTSRYISNILSTLVFGLLLGTGFASFELSLALLGHTISISEILMIIPVFAIHIISSIFLLFFIKYENKITKEMPFVLISIIFHTIGNLILFYFFV